MSKNVSSTNLDTWNIHWKDISDMAICRHELIHSEIFIQTIYGSYQSLIKKLIKYTAEDTEFWNQLLVLNYELYKQSVIAHEVVATYCSIKQLAIELIENYLRTLPNEYNNYYNTLSNLIDPHIKSTYGQYLIGHRLLSICFNSNLQQDIERSLGSFNCNCYIDTSNSPNLRLNKILNELRDSDFAELDNRLKELLNKELLHLGIMQNFDYQNEDNWNKLGTNKVNQLNKLLGDYIYNYFEELLRDRDVLSCDSIESAQAGVLNIISNLDKDLSVRILSEYDLDKLKIEGLSQTDNEIVRNKYINDSLISNSVVYNFDQKYVTNDRIPIFRHENWVGLNELSVIHSDKILNPNNKDDIWFVIKTRSNDYITSACCINKEMYINKVNNINSAPIFSGKEIDTNIIGVNASCFTDTSVGIENRVTDVIKNIFTGYDSYLISRTNRQRNNQKHLETKLKNIVWYMHGDFVAWINFLLSFKKLKYFSVHFNDKNVTNLNALVSKKSLSDSVFFGAVVFYSEYLPGTFVRYYNINTYQLVLLTILKLVDDKRISVEDSSRSSTRRFHEKKIIRSFKVVESVWEYY
jgi:hypothetical protein